MGRKKTYHRDELIEQSMELFRDHGYAGTSTQMLVEALGINRYSLYAEFGTKQGLFDVVLERYDNQVVERNFATLETPHAGIAEIRSLLESFASAGTGPAAGRGCLLCNTAVELGPTDPSGAGFVQRYFQRLSDAFHTALTNAHSHDELHPDADPRKEADSLTASVLGLYVMLRATAPHATIQHAATAALEHLNTLTNQPHA